MKTKSFFTALMAAATLFVSCSKDSETPAGSDGAMMNVRLSYGDASTYAVDDPLTAGQNTTLASVLMYQMVGDNVLRVQELTSEQISQMIGTSGLKIENVNTTVNGILIVGNAPGADKTALTALTTRAAIEAYGLTVASQQTGTAGSGVVNVTLMGYGAATTTGTSTSGATQKTAAVTVRPLVARMQVSGRVASSTDASNQIQSIAWKKVFFNRYYTDNGKGTMQEYGPADTQWNNGYPAWATDTYTTATETANSKCYAYQFFPATSADMGLLPMIVMQADVTLKDNRVLENYYITIKTFLDTTNAPITQMNVNRIYNVDLSKLTVDHTDFTPEPNPGQVDLTINVSVEAWTVQNITPSI